MRRLARDLVRPAACAILLAGAVAGPAPALASDPLAKLAFAVGDNWLFDAPSIGQFGDPGSWSFDRGRMVDGRLDLHFEITPVRQTLPVRSGPAVLFGGLILYGDAGGDVGIEVRVPTIVHKLIPACLDDDACRYTVDISIPTDDLPAAINRVEQDGDLIWVGANLTLVRTFGAGQWLQVLPLEQGPGGIAASAAGRLGAMEPTSGSLHWAGLFPAAQAVPIDDPDILPPDPPDYGAIVERLRASIDDPSVPLPAVDVALHVEFAPVCAGWTELALHDDLGNDLYYSNTNYDHPVQDVSTTMPIGSPWFLTVDAGEGVQVPMVRLGPIQSDGSGSPVGINARIDCAKRSGTLVLTGALTPTPIPTRPPLSSVGPPAPTPAGASPSPVPTSATSGSSVPVLSVVLFALGAGLVVALILRRRALRS